MRRCMGVLRVFSPTVQRMRMCACVTVRAEDSVTVGVVVAVTSALTRSLTFGDNQSFVNVSCEG